VDSTGSLDGGRCVSPWERLRPWPAVVRPALRASRRGVVPRVPLCVLLRSPGCRRRVPVCRFGVGVGRQPACECRVQFVEECCPTSLDSARTGAWAGDLEQDAGRGLVVHAAARAGPRASAAAHMAQALAAIRRSGGRGRLAPLVLRAEVFRNREGPHRRRRLPPCRRRERVARGDVAGGVVDLGTGGPGGHRATGGPPSQPNRNACGTMVGSSTGCIRSLPRADLVPAISVVRHPPRGSSRGCRRSLVHPP